MQQRGLMFNILLILLSSIAGGVLYRMGGAAGFNTKFRDFGCPTIALVTLWLLHAWNWWLIPCFGLYFGALTTYWKKKGTDAHWYNWALTGLGYSLAFLPYSIATGHWVGFGIRTVVVTAATTLWSQFISNAVIEEFGRGFIATVTLPLLLI